MARKLRGLIAATYTPMHADGSLNLSEVPKMVAHLEQSGISGIYVCGSTGEGMSLTSDERRALAEAFLSAAKGRLKTIIHVGHNSLVEARQLAKHGQEVSADAISATAPSYYKIQTVEMLVDSVAKVASGAPELPFYYYHMPSLTGASLDMQRFLELADRRVPNLAGIKYTAPQVHEYQACREMMGGKFDMVWGTDEMLLSALAVGARCAIGSTYNIVAPLNQGILNAFDDGNLRKASELQSEAIRLIKLLKKYPYHAALKSILSRFGIECGPCRLPLDSLTDAQENQLHQELESSAMNEWLYEKQSPDHLTEENQNVSHAAVPAPHIGRLAKKYD